MAGAASSTYTASCRKLSIEHGCLSQAAPARLHGCTSLVLVLVLVLAMMLLPLLVVLVLALLLLLMLGLMVLRLVPVMPRGIQKKNVSNKIAPQQNKTAKRKNVLSRL